MRDRTLKERQRERGRWYIRKEGAAPGFRLRQLITPRVVFTLNKGRIMGEGSNHWAFSLKRREATNL